MNRRLSLVPRAGLVRVTLLVMAVSLVVLSSTAWACPGCKEALAAGDGSGGDLVSGFFWSIIFMLSMPFLIFTVFCTSMYVAVRRARAAQAKAALASAEATAPTDHGVQAAPSPNQSLVGA
ncbi:MAG TPA: hypothetical protein VMF30_04620 [Pirellulales bacterium]|nr:hypothetical protein [Pirellulales bacterium]